MYRVSAYRQREKVIGGMFETIEEAIIYTKGLRDGYRTSDVDIDFVHSADVIDAVENGRPYINAGETHCIYIYDADTFFQDPLNYEV